MGRFVAWLRLPPAGRDGGLLLLPFAQHHCGAVTVNRRLSAVGSFYEFHARAGDLRLLWRWSRFLDRHAQYSY